MFLCDGATDADPSSLVISATDLVDASECEYRSLRRWEEVTGAAGLGVPPRPAPKAVADPMRARAAALGDVHERRVLEELRNQPRPGAATGRLRVHEVVRGRNSRAELDAKHGETLDALARGVDVVFQATFFDGEFLGYADFLVRQDDGRYAVWDSKLARHAKVGALLQLAAYGDQLIAAGLRPSPEVTLVLGDRQHASFSLPDLVPAFRERRQRFWALLHDQAAASVPVRWLQPGVTACGRCAYCTDEIKAHQDLLLVWGMNASRRKALMSRGIVTVTELATMPANGISAYEARLRDQARMQLGLDHVDGSRTVTVDGEQHTVSFKVLPDHTLHTLPAPSPGDIFFDFEGDPLWRDPSTGVWGLEYLFGVIEAPHGDGRPRFRPFWAHHRGEERQAFTDFLDYVEERRTRWPDMHVYHYAAYEKSALRRLSLTHTAGEDVVDDWLRSNLLVDLYATVRNSVRLSARSYSIKKLEPLYMGDKLRAGAVMDAAASVEAYHLYCDQRDAGATDTAERTLTSIADYNEYDCRSTLGLRDWLLGLRGDRPDTAPSSASGAAVPVERAAAPMTPEERTLRDYLDRLPTDRPLTPTEQTVAMVAAATGYHRREDKQFWWGHFDRLASPVEDWADDRDVFVVEDAEILSDWAKATPRARMVTRTVRLRGTPGEGSDFRADTTCFRMFDPPVPSGLANPAPETGRDGQFATLITEVGEDDRGSYLVIQEKTTKAVPAYAQLPMALTPDLPINTGNIRAALAELATSVAGALPELPPHPGIEIVRRGRPRLTSLGALPPVEVGTDGLPGYARAITAAVRDLDHSYLAVQGPPGTGKTYVGAHVIAELVRDGWKVGVVSQSHAVVDTMLLTAIERAGVDPARVAKKPKHPDATVAWAITDQARFASLLQDGDGCLIGGTTWTMTSTCIPAGCLDLLVIDEAGQYSLANTLAVSRASSRLLLLGDPQQLPQVTQATHPEPVDESALGWLSKGHATLPSEFGYFLADSWRMHPDLCAAVSRLSYDGRLTSAAQAHTRHLDGVSAGVETVLVDHAGNTTSSPEEADEVVRQARRHVGLTWNPGGGSPARRLQPEDVLVVAAYNAQVNLITHYLAEAGLSGVRVGTVDRFQGQEAPVVLVSMACSAASEAPRGISFLLNRNRVNVAVSRGQWRAVVIRSPELTHFLPGKPAELEELGAFIGLCNPEFAWDG